MFCFSQITITQSITYLAKKSIEVETQAFSFWYKNYCFSMPLCVGKEMKFRYLRVRKYIINHVGDEMKQGSLKFSNSDTPTADPQLVTEAQQKVTTTAASSHLFMFAHCSRLPNFTLWKFGKEYSCHHGIITKLTFNLNKKKILTLMFVANSQVQVHLLNLTRVVAQWPALAAGKGSLLLHSWKISASYSHEP